MTPNERAARHGLPPVGPWKHPPKRRLSLANRILPATTRVVNVAVGALILVTIGSFVGDFLAAFFFGW